MAIFLSRSSRLRPLLSIPRHPFPPHSVYAFSTSEVAPPPPQAPPPQTPEKEKRTWSKLLLFLPGAITFGLGSWQLFRRQEKIEMLDYRRKRLEMEPVMSDELYSSGTDDFSSSEFRRVICEGNFDESKSIFVGPRSRSISGVTENGYYVITPLVPREKDSSKLPVLVNRGWVPRGWRNKHLEPSSNSAASSSEAVNAKENGRSPWWAFWSGKSKTSKAVETIAATERVIGVIRGSEKPSIFVPANDPDNGQWFYVDSPAIARACGLPENTVYLEDINENVSASNPYPLPKDINKLIHHSVMPQDHLNYTMTWYSLSAAVTFMAVQCIRPKKIRR